MGELDQTGSPGPVEDAIWSQTPVVSWGISSSIVVVDEWGDVVWVNCDRKVTTTDQSRGRFRSRAKLPFQISDSNS